MVVAGLIITFILAILGGAFAFWLTHSIIVTILFFIIAWGFCYSVWAKETLPYTIQDIRDELKDRKEE